jgi:hypothetical protein
MSLPVPPLVLDDLDTLSDHDLLAGGVVATIAENRATAQKWARLVTFFRRREADDAARHEESPRFALTARQQTVVEVGELWGMPESWVRKQLNIALCLSTHFAFVWELCLGGRIDSYRASIIADAARYGLDKPDEYAALARRVDAFLTRRLKPLDDIPDSDLESVVHCSPKQLRNKLTYEINKIRSADAEARHRKAKAARDVRATDGDDGMSWLTIMASTDQVQLAGHRLTLAAKDLRRRGDERTLDQLRSDLAIDLLTGRADGVPLPTYARPVVNLTVPIQTVMGLSDDPGVLSGGQVIPAGLARVIAQTPGSTWHRMLTDPAGRMVELSTSSYSRPRRSGPRSWPSTAPAFARDATPPRPRRSSITGSHGPAAAPRGRTYGRAARQTTRPSTPPASRSSRTTPAASSWLRRLGSTTRSCAACIRAVARGPRRPPRGFSSRRLNSSTPSPGSATRTLPPARRDTTSPGKRTWMRFSGSCTTRPADLGVLVGAGPRLVRPRGSAGRRTRA